MCLASCSTSRYLGWSQCYVVWSSDCVAAPCVVGSHLHPSDIVVASGMLGFKRMWGSLSLSVVVCVVFDSVMFRVTTLRFIRELLRVFWASAFV